jgi:hypothetical protein
MNDMTHDITWQWSTAEWEVGPGRGHSQTAFSSSRASINIRRWLLVITYILPNK